MQEIAKIVNDMVATKLSEKLNQYDIVVEGRIQAALGAVQSEAKELREYVSSLHNEIEGTFLLKIFLIP